MTVLDTGDRPHLPCHWWLAHQCNRPRASIAKDPGGVNVPSPG